MFKNRPDDIASRRPYGGRAREGVEPDIDVCQNFGLLWQERVLMGATPPFRGIENIAPGCMVRLGVVLKRPRGRAVEGSQHERVFVRAWIT